MQHVSPSPRCSILFLVKRSSAYYTLVVVESSRLLDAMSRDERDQLFDSARQHRVGLFSSTKSWQSGRVDWRRRVSPLGHIERLLVDQAARRERLVWTRLSFSLLHQPRLERVRGALEMRPLSERRHIGESARCVWCSSASKTCSRRRASAPHSCSTFSPMRHTSATGRRSLASSRSTSTTCLWARVAREFEQTTWALSSPFSATTSTSVSSTTHRFASISAFPDTTNAAEARRRTRATRNSSEKVVIVLVVLKFEDFFERNIQIEKRRLQKAVFFRSKKFNEALSVDSVVSDDVDGYSFLFFIVVVVVFFGVCVSSF